MSELVQLSIFVDPDSWVGQFDSLELWRARLSEAGPYEPLMGDSWRPARIPDVEGSAPNPPQAGPSTSIVGLTLSLLINEETPVEVTFSGTNPLTFAQAAAQIQDAAPTLLRAFVLDGRMVLETVEAGSGSILRVVGGNAAPLLGLPTAEPEALAFGLDARIPLNPAVTNYTYADKHSSSEYFYKARFYNATHRTVSQFGAPFTGQGVAGVSGSSLVLGFADFIDTNGNARKNVEVLLYARTDGKLVEGRVLVPAEATRLLSDENGRVEMNLVRGTRVTVAVGGTDLVRDIDVPVDQAITSFNLLDPTKGTNDLFKVQIPNIDYAARRSL